MIVMHFLANVTNVMERNKLERYYYATQAYTDLNHTKKRVPLFCIQLCFLFLDAYLNLFIFISLTGILLAGPGTFPQKLDFELTTFEMDDNK